MADLVLRDWAARLVGRRPADLTLDGIEHRDDGFTARFLVLGEPDALRVVCRQAGDAWKVQAILANEHGANLGSTIAYGDIVVAPER
jgi:hypothetical protein